MSDVTALLPTLPGPVLLLGVTVLLMLEGGVLAGLLVPGTAIALGAGALAQMGTVSPSHAVLAAVAGAVAGGQLGYRRGLGWPGNGTARRLAPATDRVLTVVQGAPAIAVVGVGQWLSCARVLVPRIARASGMPYCAFTVAQSVSAMTWASTMVAIGYMGSAVTRQNLGAGLGVLAVVAGGALLLPAARPSRTRPTEARAARAEARPSRVL